MRLDPQQGVPSLPTPLLLLVLLLLGARASTPDEPLARLHERIHFTPLRQTPFHNIYLPVTSTAYNLTAFNFSGPCGTLFTHPPASSRDVIVFSLGAVPPKRLASHIRQINMVLSLMRSTMPNVTAVLLLFHDFARNVIGFFDAWGLEIYRVKGLHRWHAVNARIPAVYAFLIENGERFDRVLWSDFRDVYFFADIFSTVGTDKLRWLSEELDDGAGTKFDHEINYQWTTQFYTEPVAVDLMRRGVYSVNGGFGIGSVDKMVQFLGDLYDNIDRHFIGHYGYDQSLMNYVIYYNLTRAVELEKCGQRMCMFGEDFFEFKHNALFFKKSGCSPVSKHKSVPRVSLKVKPLRRKLPPE